MIEIDANDKEVAAIALLSFQQQKFGSYNHNDTIIKLWQLPVYHWRLSQSHTIGISNVHFELTPIDVKSGQLILFDVN